jgi:hypothetical protein
MASTRRAPTVRSREESEVARAIKLSKLADEKELKKSVHEIEQVHEEKRKRDVDADDNECKICFLRPKTTVWVLEGGRSCQHAVCRPCAHWWIRKTTNRTEVPFDEGPARCYVCAQPTVPPHFFTFPTMVPGLWEGAPF